MSTNGKYVLITGATIGIGYELAKLFAKDGYNLVTVARNQRDLERTANEFREFGIAVVPISKDLFEKEAAFELYVQVKAKGIEPEILVNNAAQGLYGEFLETDIQRELDIIQLNTASLVVLTKFYLKDMVARGSGKILNVASVASKIPGPLQSIYHATKAFVLSFSEAIREEVKDTGVTITALMPGVTDTDFFAKADMLDSKVVQDKDKMADPADVAMDGYKALMNGDDKIVSGFANKIQVAMSNIIPDSVVAAKTHKQQEPVNGDD